MKAITGMSIISKVTMRFSGAYGTVYKARDTLSDTIVAIKKVKSTLTYMFLVSQINCRLHTYEKLTFVNHDNRIIILIITR